MVNRALPIIVFLISLVSVVTVGQEQDRQTPNLRAQFDSCFERNAEILLWDVASHDASRLEADLDDPMTGKNLAAECRLNPSFVFNLQQYRQTPAYSCVERNSRILFDPSSSPLHSAQLELEDETGKKQAGTEKNLGAECRLNPSFVAKSYAPSAAPNSNPNQSYGTSPPASQHAPARKDIPTIAKASNGSVVSIVMSDKDGKPLAQGSGFFVSKDGLVVTNYHVIAEGSSAVAKLPDGAMYVLEGVVASDKKRDIAVVKATGKNFRTLTLGNSDRVEVGQEVVAIGNPLSLESTVSNGIVSGLRTADELGGRFLQVTAPISPGSSGGPLFNMAGEVIGITTLYLKGGENLNFAIPVNDAKRLLADPCAGITPPPGLVLDRCDKTVKAWPNETPPAAESAHSSPPDSGRGREIDSPQFKYYEALLLAGENAVVKGTYACFDDDPKSNLFRVISAHPDDQKLFVGVFFFRNGVYWKQALEVYLGALDWNSSAGRLPRDGTWSDAAYQAIHDTDHVDWSADQITIETAFGGPSDPMQAEGGYFATRFVLQRSSLRFVETFSPRGSVYDGLVKGRVKFSDAKSPRMGQCIQIPGSRTPEEERESLTSGR
jgi:S1-C subfamily serine protease